MNFYDVLIRFYENHLNDFHLLPEYHTTMQTSIEITISEEGEFLNIEKINGSIVIPGTVQSIGRSNGTSPHALFDNLTYLGNTIYDQDRYQAYIAQLKQLISDDAFPEYVKIIYRYLEKGTCYDDVMKSVDSLKKKQPQMIGVRIQIQTSDSVIRPWNDANLIEKWIAYSDRILPRNGFDVIAGEKAYIPSKSPSKIRNDSDMAKLFIMNQDSLDSMPPAFAGIKSMHKVCASLSYLCRNNQYVCGNTYFLLWTDDGTLKNPLSFEHLEYTTDTVHCMALTGEMKGRISIVLTKDIEKSEYNRMMDIFTSLLEKRMYLTTICNVSEITSLEREITLFLSTGYFSYNLYRGALTRNAVSITCAILPLTKYGEGLLKKIETTV